jgi:hypothetical protein
MLLIVDFQKLEYLIMKKICKFWLLLLNLKLMLYKEQAELEEYLKENVLDYI